jgi:diacylglycerol kinase family enzyme
MSRDAPLHIVLNRGSGKHDGEDVEVTIARTLSEAQRAYTIHTVTVDDDVEARAHLAVEAAKASSGIVVAAGGDGTINTVASATLGSGCPFGVIPLGTFNYFSRAHGIPSDVVGACGILLTARAQPVQVGQVNDRPFLVNSSIGLYPELLEDREQAKKRFGRSRVVAFAAALATLLRPHRKLRLEIQTKQGRRSLSTSTLFVGNNRLQLLRVGIPEAQLVERHRLLAVAPRAVGVWATLKLLLRAALGRLGDAPDVELLDFERMVVTPRQRGRGLKVAADGETSTLPSPLSFQVSPHPLLLLRPEEPGDDPG